MDSYIITADTIREPPASLLQKMRFLGPGFILSASIVGSGELIATTVLGAKAGFTALWIIILSCVIKVAVQLEFGKNAVLTGETAMQALNRLPGPRMGKAKWPVWLFFVLLLLKIIQIGGIIGGSSIVLNMLLPSIPITAWTLIIAGVVGALIFNGRYSWVEKLSLGMIALFTLLTLGSLYALRFTPYDFTFSELLHGMRFSLSGEVVGYAIGAFGITGVAADEIIAYNYWCLEKGYARHVGRQSEDAAWKRRARGWIHVMYLDATVAMVIYTVVTVAFYLLGAAVLHERSEIPMGNRVIEVLALIYTQSLGQGVKVIYLVGAFFVLFSSLFASLAAWTRIFSDVFGQVGWIDFFDTHQRRKSIALLAWFFPIAWATAYFFINLPVLMVLSGGVVGSVMLILVVFAALKFKYGSVQVVRSGLLYDVAFWLSVISIFGLGVYGLWSVM